MTMIARKCPDVRVDVVDINAERIAAWNSDSLPVFEPGLDEIVRHNRGKNGDDHNQQEAQPKR